MTSFDSPRTVCFVLLPHVHLLDLSGAAQVFYEAANIGPSRYKVVFAGTRKKIISEQGLMLGDINSLNNVVLKKGDLIFVPGIDFRSFKEGRLKEAILEVKDWLWAQYSRGIQIGSICSGALILAETGILNGKKCTSHWKCIDHLRKFYPQIKVQTDQLFVKDQNIYTSAGMTSGIDMALSILEEQHGPLLSARVAREMVVYMRRNDTDRQETIYLDYKTHFNPSVHKVQDYIIAHPARNFTLEELASVGNTSVRSLTRVFRTTTGHTIVEFRNAIKLELARTLIHNPEFTMRKLQAFVVSGMRGISDGSGGRPRVSHPSHSGKSE